MHRIRKHLQKQTQTQRRQQNNENTKEKDMYEEVHILFLLGQGPVFEEEFFVDPKNGTKKTNKPPAMQVCSQIALASSKKPPIV